MYYQLWTKAKLTNRSRRAGGMYSTTRDLSNLARSIIQNSRLTSAQTRRWLKPVAHTASLELSVGATWEIRRAKLNPLNHRVVDLYTKTGSVGSYGSLIVLIPDYDVAFTILTAGYNNSLVDILAEMLMETFLPVLEQVSKEQAANAFAGIYASTTAINSSLSLITDDGPGLAIDAWISNGTDVLDTFKSLADATGGGRPVGRVRVYPTELTSPASNAEPTGKHAFRAVFQVADKSESDANHRREIFSEDCSTWSSVDEPMYGNNAVDDFIFHTDLHENVVSVELRAFRASLVKKLGQGVEHKEGVNEASMAVL